MRLQSISVFSTFLCNNCLERKQFAMSWGQLEPFKPLFFVVRQYVNMFIRRHIHVNGLVQDCSNSIANALELLQSCTKPSMWLYTLVHSLVMMSPEATTFGHFILSFMRPHSQHFKCLCIAFCFLFVRLYGEISHFGLSYICYFVGINWLEI